MKWVHPRCGKTVSGMRAAHCAICCESFTTPNAFALHLSKDGCVDPASRGLVYVDWRQMWRYEGERNDLQSLLQ